MNLKEIRPEINVKKAIEYTKESQNEEIPKQLEQLLDTIVSASSMGLRSFQPSHIYDANKIELKRRGFMAKTNYVNGEYKNNIRW